MEKTQGNIILQRKMPSKENASSVAQEHWEVHCRKLLTRLLLIYIFDVVTFTGSKFKQAKDATNIVILIRFYEAINYLLLGHMVHRMIEPDVTFKESVITSFTQCTKQRAQKCKS